MQPTQAQLDEGAAFFASMPPRALEVILNLEADPYHYEKLAAARQAARVARAEVAS